MIGPSSSLTIEECSFTGNVASGEYPKGKGGGIYNSSSTPTFQNCTVSSNSSSYARGGTGNYGAAPTFVNCLIYNNVTSGYGGGISNVSSADPVLTNCTIYGYTFPPRRRIR